MQRSPSDESAAPSEATQLTAPLARLLARYGNGSDGSTPTREQWSRLLDGPTGIPVTLVNFFKLRAKAQYEDADGRTTGQPETATLDRAESGGEAMMRYASVSGPALEKVGGRFLLMAPFEASLMGAEESWDLVVIGSYPSREAAVALFEDEAYAQAYAHRRAAVERQRVMILRG